MGDVQFHIKHTNNQGNLAPVLQYFRTCLPQTQPHGLGEHASYVTVVRWWFTFSPWYHLLVRSVSSLYSFTLFYFILILLSSTSTWHAWNRSIDVGFGDFGSFISLFSSSLIIEKSSAYASGVNVIAWLLYTAIVDDASLAITKSIDFSIVAATAARFSAPRILFLTLAVTNGNQSVGTLRNLINIWQAHQMFTLVFPPDAAPADKASGALLSFPICNFASIKSIILHKSTSTCTKCSGAWDSFTMRPPFTGRRCGRHIITRNLWTPHHWYSSRTIWSSRKKSFCLAQFRDSEIFGIETFRISDTRVLEICDSSDLSVWRRIRQGHRGAFLIYKVRPNVGEVDFEDQWLTRLCWHVLRLVSGCTLYP